MHFTQGGIRLLTREWGAPSETGRKAWLSWHTTLNVSSTNHPLTPWTVPMQVFLQHAYLSYKPNGTVSYGLSRKQLQRYERDIILPPKGQFAKVGPRCVIRTDYCIYFVGHESVPTSTTKHNFLYTFSNKCLPFTSSTLPYRLKSVEPFTHVFLTIAFAFCFLPTPSARFLTTITIWNRRTLNRCTHGRRF